LADAQADGNRLLNNCCWLISDLNIAEIDKEVRPGHENRLGLKLRASLLVEQKKHFVTLEHAASDDSLNSVGVGLDLVASDRMDSAAWFVEFVRVDDDHVVEFLVPLLGLRGGRDDAGVEVAVETVNSLERVVTLHFADWNVVPDHDSLVYCDTNYERILSVSLLRGGGLEDVDSVSSHAKLRAVECGELEGLDVKQRGQIVHSQSLRI